MPNHAKSGSARSRVPWRNPLLRSLGLLLLFGGALAAQSMHAVGNIFKPLATPAEEVSDLSILTLAICATIFVVVGGLMAYAVIRFGYRHGDSAAEPPQVYGSRQVEIAWTVVPILIVFVLTMATARVDSAVQDHRMPADALKITVIGHQWWWEFRYTDLNIVTANEIHVPLSSIAKPRLTELTLKSADVAHGFWVPQLAGKTDVIPGRTNHMWIDPKELGIYLGNCSEYCGTQHARMELRVIVDSDEDFAKWVANQQTPSAKAAEGSTDISSAFTASACIACHTVGGTRARGKMGPDLTHLMSRETIAAMETPNNAENLREWIKDPQKMKPGNKMPAVKISDAQLDRMVAYLTTLQ